MAAVDDPHGDLTFRVSVSSADPAALVRVRQVIEASGLTVLSSGLTGLDVRGPKPVVEAALHTHVVMSPQGPQFNPPTVVVGGDAPATVRLYFPSRPTMFP